MTKSHATKLWIHEIKFDGYRVQVHIRDGTVTVFTRRGHDWTKRFKKVASDAFEINAVSAIIDGEVVVPSPEGITDSSVLQKRTEGPINQDRAGRVRFAYLNGYNLRAVARQSP